MNSIEIPSSGLPEQFHDKSVESTLAKDFYLSYKYSQGDSGIQAVLFRLMRDYYKEQYDEADIQTVLNVSTDHLIELVEPYKLPRSHHLIGHLAESIEQTKMNEFKRQAADLTFLLKETESTIALDIRLRDEPDDKLTLGTKLITRDIELIKKGRKVGRDSRASFFREYALNAQPTGSDAFDNIFEQVGQTLDPTNLVNLPQKDTIEESIKHLAAVWGAYHPDESFYPVAA